MENENTSGDVIDQQATGSVTTEGDTSAQPEATPETHQPQVGQLPTDRPVQNYEAEWHRKYNSLVENLPKMVEEVVSTKVKPQEQEWSISQLEAYAMENPNYRPWVEEKKAELIQKRIFQSTEERLKKEREEQTRNQARQQAEMQLLSDPRYADAFVTLPNGQKTWNQQSKLAQLMGQYINDETLKNRPDGLLIAAKLAKADLLDSSVPQVQNQITSLKRQTAQLQTKTMAEGSGVPTQVNKKDPFIEAKSQLAKTGKFSDAQVAVKEYLKRIKKVD